MPVHRESYAISIPIRGTEEVMEIWSNELPSGDEMHNILKAEQCQLRLWLEAAIAYYRIGDLNTFLMLLETSGPEATLGYQNVEKDQMLVLDILAAHYAQIGRNARSAKDRDKRKEAWSKATLLYTTADKIQMYEDWHLLGRAYFCMLEGQKNEQADTQFNFVLNHLPNCIPAILGKACLYFQKKDYRNALFMYRKCLKLKPDCPASVRVGIGHCLAKLKQFEKAKIAFRRALEVDDECVEAMVGLATLMLTDEVDEPRQTAIRLLERAYNIEREHPHALNHLAAHFFTNGTEADIAKAEQLANYALLCAESDAIKAESCFQLARVHHHEKNYDKAFRLYYQSTQLASPNFILPQFGLGQMYMQRGDYNNAIACFEKILTVHADNVEALKMLGSLCAHAVAEDPNEQPARLAKAHNYLARVLEKCPDDMEVLIDLAQLCEQNEPKKSLVYYQRIVALFTANEIEIPAEFFNNIGALQFILGQYEEATASFNTAEQKIAHDLAAPGKTSTGLAELAGMRVSILYNRARALEELGRLEEAEALYKQVARLKNDYIDCLLRLGCICRDAGNIHDASIWFKEAMRINPQHADAWTLIGNLHMAKGEWGPAQKKFEYVLKMPEHKDDSYAAVALGNIWLETLFAPGRDKSKDRTHGDRALQMYKRALQTHPKNLYAANGIGCVLATRGHLQEARDIFAQVREATADVFDVWMNIGHIYVEQRQFVGAIQMYQSAIKKFGKESDVAALVYLARAFFRADKITDCRHVLEKALQEEPDNALVKFNYAYVLKHQATHILEAQSSSLAEVEGAVADLHAAERVFRWLEKHVDDGLTARRFVPRKMAEESAQRCNDLLVQSATYLERARAADEAENAAKRRQEQELIALREQQERVERERQAETQQRIEQLRKTRQIFVDMTKEFLKIPEIPDEEKIRRKSRGGGGGGGGGGRGRRRRGEDGEEFVNDDSDLGDWQGEGGEPSSSSRRKLKKGGRSKRTLGEAQPSSGSDGELDPDAAEARRQARRKQNFAAKEEKLSQKQSAKIKSRAYVSDSSGSSDNEAPRQQQAAASDDDDEDMEEMDESANARPAAQRGGGGAGSDSSDSDENDDKDGDAPMSATKAAKAKLKQRAHVSDEDDDDDDDDDDEEGDRRKPAPKRGSASEDEEEAESNRRVVRRRKVSSSSGDGDSD